MSVRWVIMVQENGMILVVKDELNILSVQNRDLYSLYVILATDNYVTITSDII